VEGRPPGERELVLRAQRGDAHAFEKLVRPHWEIAFRLAYAITRSAADAEDAVQEAFVKGWRALERFRDSEPLRPWLLRIVANEARNRRRSAARRAQLALRAHADPLSADLLSGRAAASPEEIVVGEDERRRLLAELEGLPERARLVLTCRYLLDLSEAETASALGVRAGTVKSRTARALQQLREVHG
jgi:RNA polymerase sigma factor (sigma-70 family)